MSQKTDHAKLNDSAIASNLNDLTGWKREGDGITKAYHFKNYYEAVAFVNATAWISHHADHHPDITLGYNQCQVTYTSHDVGGLSGRDFVCAAKIDGLFKL